MINKCFACALALFILISFEFVASKTWNCDLPQLVTIHPVSISKSPTVSRSAAPPDNYQSVFRFSLWQITRASYRYGNSNDLNDFLYLLLDTREPTDDISPDVTDELHQLLIRLTRERISPQQSSPILWSRNQFKIEADFPASSSYSVFYSTPIKIDDFNCPIQLCGQNFYVDHWLESLPDFPSTFSYNPCIAQLPMAILPDPKLELAPDLSLDFLINPTFPAPIHF